MLDIINQQGAQVERLKQQVREQQLVITLLANESNAVAKRFDNKKQEAAGEQIEEVTWKQNKDGTIVVNIKRYGK